MEESQNYYVELKKLYTKESILDISADKILDYITLIYTDRKKISNCLERVKGGWRHPPSSVRHLCGGTDHRDA